MKLLEDHMLVFLFQEPVLVLQEIVKIVITENLSYRVKDFLIA